MEAANRLSELLKLLRLDRGHSSRRFASVCGLSRETLRQYEAGVALPSNQSLMKILTAVGLNPEKDEEAKKIVSSLYEERAKREPSKKRAFGVSANAELLGFLSTRSVSEDKIDRLLDLFFEHCEVKRNDSLEHFLRRNISRILED